MNYVLIALMIAGGNFRPPSVITADFHTAAACNRALEYFQGINKDRAAFIAGGCFKKDL